MKLEVLVAKESEEKSKTLNRNSNFFLIIKIYPVDSLDRRTLLTSSEETGLTAFVFLRTGFKLELNLLSNS